MFTKNSTIVFAFFLCSCFSDDFTYTNDGGGGEITEEEHTNESSDTDEITTGTTSEDITTDDITSEIIETDEDTSDFSSEITTDSETLSTTTEDTETTSSSEILAHWSPCFSRGLYETCEETCASLDLQCARECGTNSLMSVWTTEHMTKCEQWYNCPNLGETCGRDTLCDSPAFYPGQDNQAYRCCCR